MIISKNVDSFVCGDDNERVNVGYSANGVCAKLAWNIQTRRNNESPKVGYS